VLWEAQFGDFVNGAQVILDQFLVAGREKWGQESSLVLLLPHGYEGQGPEHSSARLERFLQLSAENNIRVANCTTPAQYFHLLRRQALAEQKRPLIVMTPKSLLRHPRATSTLEQLTDGKFHVVVDDTSVKDASAVGRVVLCSGKIYYDVVAAIEKEGASGIALVRVEQLYPFPSAELRDVLERYSSARDVAWVQEEPRNMGAWSFMEPRLKQLAGERATVRYIGRVERASPAEGYATDHEAEQNRIVGEAIAKPSAGKAASGANRRKRKQKAD
jgi:2-oxoglutarate dehydrogenase E1 component